MYIVKNMFGRGRMILFVAVILICVSSSVQSQITGSAHDFSSSTWSDNQICMPCHTPHNADLTVTDSPLWDHKITCGIFTLYTSPTLDPLTTATITQPGGASKLCLSCHDGTVAIDSFGNVSGCTYMPGASSLGTDLSDDHPVSFDWKHQVTNTPNCAHCHFGGEDSRVTFFNNASGEKRRIECATCHDVHNSFPANIKMLRYTVSGSELCLSCHGK